MADSTLYYLGEQQVSDYQEGRRARLAREREESLREMRRISEKARNLLTSFADAIPDRELVQLCRNMLDKAERFADARRDAEQDGALVEGP